MHGISCDTSSALSSGTQHSTAAATMNKVPGAPRGMTACTSQAPVLCLSTEDLHTGNKASSMHAVPVTSIKHTHLKRDLLRMVLPAWPMWSVNPCMDIT
jgi:hypothetical protein